jgi:hypothetical protein
VLLAHRRDQVAVLAAGHARGSGAQAMILRPAFRVGRLDGLGKARTNNLESGQA